MLHQAPPPLPSGTLDAAVDRRGTASRKMQGRNGAYLGKDVVPLWVADMDFRSPQPIVDALVARAQDGVYGYTDCPPELAETFLARLETVYGCTAQKPAASWLRWLPGLLPGLNHAVRATCSPTRPDDAVAIPTPIYAPFLDAPRNCGASCRPVPLIETRRGDGATELHYTIDLARLEAECADPHVKLLHFCNPHNPVGRCWTRAELEAVARLCVAHDVVLCSDEVWGEMPLDSTAHPFTSMLSLLPSGGAGEGGAAGEPGRGESCGVNGLMERLIVLTSPSKCFNVAPLDIAVAVIPDADLWR